MAGSLRLQLWNLTFPFGQPPIERLFNPSLNGFHNRTVCFWMKQKEEATGSGCTAESEEAAEKASEIVTQSEKSRGLRKRPKCLVTPEQPLKQWPTVASIRLFCMHTNTHWMHTNTHLYLCWIFLAAEKVRVGLTQNKLRRACSLYWRSSSASRTVRIMFVFWATTMGLNIAHRTNLFEATQPILVGWDQVIAVFLAPCR